MFLYFAVAVFCSLHSEQLLAQSPDGGSELEDRSVHKTPMKTTGASGRYGGTEGVGGLELRSALLVEHVEFGDREAC